jgi:cytoskeleton-associated protein 5
VSAECLSKFAERISLQNVLAEMYEPLRKTKNPKTLSDALLWIHQSVLDFGVAGLLIKDLIDFLKFALGNSNSTVRNNSVTVLGGLRMFVGAGVQSLFKSFILFNCFGLDIRSFLVDLTPQILTTIDAEFEKVESRVPPNPSKVQLISVCTSSPIKPYLFIDLISCKSESLADPVELFPRVDLSPQITQQLLDVKIICLSLLLQNIKKMKLETW